ncbi:PEP/pyruvate-binding domain-containing protein [Caproiciproducens faecalis]|uniref:Pyruvate kinase n=1 Tax=Caproiciproducens faecalis TaxID=2820301 RepID=A0ABS7DM08_9FIRM|nr:PEP/pyruvate-binding domain-containing protein [Caproiciproducens faecalis]MBW7572121.1 pyruvate kinase [Caproiciproducens faecalis]
MNIHERVSTGLGGFDRVIDSLRLGDNVVWQVDAVADYQKMAELFVRQAKQDRRKLIYFRFAAHEPILRDDPEITVYRVGADKGFEGFVAEVYSLVKKEGRKAFYVFDCLTDLLEYWHSDLMIENFFKVICPFLYELDTVAYFAIKRNIHTYSTIAGIRETTQLLLDLYRVGGKFYIHPLKVLKRYSPTMFFPHLIENEEAVSITSSAEAAELFSGISRGEERLDYWDVIFNRAKEAVHLATEQQEEIKKSLMTMLIGGKSRMFDLCDRYFTLNDILTIYSREVGTGFIGGKSVGMLLARKILEQDGENRFAPFLESHDSYYLGSDLFYTYLVQNGLWKLRMKQKTESGYFQYAPELKERLLHGRFSETIQEQFLQMLEHFGQSPIIVRSSSLLEDNFGNAFAGKYDSIFCVNQGTPEARYEAFEQAIRTVYASTMNEDALSYRISRGLSEKDEQMAILVQRVSGDYHRENYFPHIAGVGNSSNLYVWDKSVDMEAGMLRLVFGLGTRAVDRTVGDYVKIVCLDDPMRNPPADYEDLEKFSQHFVDVLSLEENTLTSRSLEEILSNDIHTDKELFAGPDYRAAARLRELGYTDRKAPHVLHFEKLLKSTDFPRVMKEILALLSDVYEYPVDIEFTANFRDDRHFRVNLLQCRPLQTKGLGQSVEFPILADEQDCFFATEGNFMGGNVHLPIDYVVYVQPKAYLNLSEQDKYMVARQIGTINASLKGKNAMLIGPGRWGTTTPSLGVPVHFSELCNMSVICEVASQQEGFLPELSYGSHFFQDLVETDIFYAAIFNGQKNVIFHPERILEKDNLFSAVLPQNGRFSDVIRIVRTDGMEIFSDIVTQRLLCR